MKRIISAVVLLSGIGAFSQEAFQGESNNKERFQIGIQYNPIVSKNNFITDSFTGVAGLNVRYNIISAGIIDFNVGLNVSLLTADENEFSDMYIWNPNVVAEFNVFDFGLKPYLGVGYNFAKTTFDETVYDGYDPAAPMTIRSTDLKYDGWNINPGLRYYFKKLVFVDAGYNYTHLSNDFGGVEHVHTVNVGAGVRF